MLARSGNSAPHPPVRAVRWKSRRWPLSCGAGGAGVPGLPCRDDWPAWNAAEMRAAVDYLEQAGAAATESGALDR